MAEQDPDVAILTHDDVADAGTEELHIATYAGSGTALCGAKDHEWRYGDPDTEATCAVCLDLWRNRSWWSRLLNKFRKRNRS